MKIASLLQTSALAAALLAFPAFAEETPKAGHDDPGTIGEGQKTENLPAPKSDYDAAPPVAAPAGPEGGYVQQAGVGGDTAYGRAGVVELGGSAGVSVSSGTSTINFSPSIGWFFQDNLQISGILGTHFNTVAGQTSTILTALAEPSYHLPFAQTVFGFLGVGFGLGYVNAPNTTNASNLGFAIAPRLGMNVLVGRSGILTPAIKATFSTVSLNAAAGQGGTGVVAIGAVPIYEMQVGYTVML